MAIRTIGLVVTDPEADAPALAAAAALARREDAHLEVRCLAVDPLGVDPGALGVMPALLESGLAEARERAASLAAWARAALPPEVRAEVEPVTALLAGLGPALARAARFCDLSVAAKPLGAAFRPLGTVVFEALLFGTGAPVLMLPDRSPDRPWDLARPFGHAVLAWNDSDEALRAARALLPLLAPGARVDVALVDPPLAAPGRAEPGGSLAPWLARHGLEVEVSVLARTAPRVADVLATFARERGAEVLAMGGYGHSPFREALIGGPTRAMLADAELPVLMAH